MNIEYASGQEIVLTLGDFQDFITFLVIKIAQLAFKLHQ